MSGDVFGNGMLLSRHIRLQVAFDHRHIFLDPSPDAGGELRRARALVRSAALELGRLRPQEDLARRRRLPAHREVDPAVDGSHAPCSASRRARRRPTEIIRATLKMPVDLLWNGGIGTYVKSSHESNAEVGDRTNDAVRINGMD